ncbi:3-ketoacyl-CoA synthase 12-like [Impatiens glandulifera]|uniref:3-ketoacyl-CoA synthase 12-like n=1 Tax=Impatiens glandulifera TaxID=253017 RepID=UPI001FB0F048|nr:3-ketoacyl-CoA synthase 12-like [Impatiens glandulifera]
MEIILLLLFYILPLTYILYNLFNFINQRRNRHCYILNYQCFKPSDNQMLTTKFSGDIVMRNKNIGLEEFKFLLKAIVSSGIGEQTYGPNMVFHGRENCPTSDDIISEMDVMFDDIIHKLLTRSNVSPSEIDVLVVNVSMLAAVPSLTARIINRYKMREDIKVYNLTGMGCSASLISINIIETIFKSEKDKLALMVTSESLTPNWYSGNDRSMILANCLFRLGGCAVLLTNKSSLKQKAMLKLKSLVRVHHGGRDESYGCCLQKEDDNGRIGFYLGRNLPKAATKAFIENLKRIIPNILPIRELLRFSIASFAWKWIYGYGSRKRGLGFRPIVNLKTGVNHFCLHTGGKAVIDGIGKSLNLNEYDLEPARMTLHRFGNTSASSLWYVLSYMEAKKRLRKSDKVFMIGFGAGFKCNSCLWEVMRDLKDDDRSNVWNESIDMYPPRSVENPFMEMYGWLNEEDEVTFDRMKVRV